MIRFNLFPVFFFFLYRLFLISCLVFFINVYFKLLSRLVFSELVFLSSLLLYLTFYSVLICMLHETFYGMYTHFVKSTINLWNWNWIDTFAKHLKTHLFGLAYSRQSTHFWVCITFCRVRHGDSVTKPDYYYYYYYYY